MNESIGKGSLSRSKLKYTLTPEGKYVFNKDANPKAPDYFGSIHINVDGADVELRLSGWIRDGKAKGEKFLSLAVEYGKNESNRLALKGAEQQPDIPTAEDDFSLADTDDGDDPLPF